MFGDFGPQVKNLLSQINTWTNAQTFSAKNQATTPASRVKLTTPTAAVGGTQQVSPSLEWEGRGFSNGTTSLPVSWRSYVLPFQGSPTYSEWKLQYQLNNGGYNEGLQFNTALPALGGKAVFTMNAIGKVSITNSSTVDTLPSLQIENPAGSNSHLWFSFNNTIRAAISSDSTGQVFYRSAGSQTSHNFYTGGSIGGAGLIAQIYGSGIYNTLNSYNVGVVTAGQGDTGATADLSTYGSFAAKGVSVIAATYNISADETLIYANPDASNVCGGTAPACTTYTNSTTCNARSLVGCSWFTGNSCSPGSGTDSGTCTGQGVGCVWDEVSCSGADNTDQTTCEAQNDSYGGSCSYDTSTCSGLTTDAGTCSGTSGCTPQYNGTCSSADGQAQATCESQGGGPATCTWTGADCHSFDSTDQSTCETSHTGCVWDGGTSLCNGVYDEGSTCSGTYFDACNGNLCNGNYNNGNCSGTFGATCQGNANCSSVTTQTPCNAEPGCEWSQGQTLTLPVTSVANRSNTSRMYAIVHSGAGGFVQINAGVGDDINGLPSVSLYQPYERVLLHNHTLTGNCSQFGSEGACTPNAGCSWGTLTCTGGDQASCEAVAGCSWSDPNCTGNEVCSGTYTVAKRWFIVNKDAAGSLFEQTASATVANTTIETSLLSTGQGTTLLPKNFFSKAGITIRVKARGYHSSTGNPTITLRIKLGSTTIGTITGSSGNGSGNEWDFDSVITCRTTGVSGTVFEQGVYTEYNSNGLIKGSQNTSATTIDTTTTKQLAVTVQWGTANAGNTITVTNLAVLLES